ncbi:MAG: ABC transporter substrate-binding protein [Verrucomicrobiales bacterium]|nr:ABC transporter substrate-binding protein [Verrucomicrobiales bacterium]
MKKIHGRNRAEAPGIGTAPAKGGVMRFCRRPSLNTVGRSEKAGVLRIGYMSNLEAVVPIAAQELGLFQRHDLRVQLSPEVGWATLRSKLLDGELEACLAPVGLLLSLYCGFGGVRRPCLTALLFDSGRCAITLSRSLRDLGVIDAVTLGLAIRSGVIRARPTFGTVPGLTSATHFLRAWLIAGGVDPDRDVRLVPVPAALAFDTFRRGFVDGFCESEPWPTAALAEDPGTVATSFPETVAGFLDKALVVLREFAEANEELHLRLVAALIEAGRFCEVPANRPVMARWLARSGSFDLPESCLQSAIAGLNAVTESGARIGAPSRTTGKRLLDRISDTSEPTLSRPLPRAILSHLFRQDLHDRAANQTRRDSGPDDVGSSAKAETPQPSLPEPTVRQPDAATLATMLLSGCLPMAVIA